MPVESPSSAAILRASQRLVESAPPFSSDLGELIVGFDQPPIRLIELFEARKGRGFHHLLLVAPPLLTPWLLPGLSVAFDLTVSVLGARLALGLNPCSPQRVLHWQLPAHSLARLAGVARPVRQGMARLVRPRLGLVGDHVVFRRLGGLLRAISGLMMMLPFPLPLTNCLPAWTVRLLSEGTLRRDGLCFIAGFTAFGLSVASFALVAVGCIHATQSLWEVWTATRGG